MSAPAAVGIALAAFFFGWLAGFFTLGMALAEPPIAEAPPAATERKLRIVADECTRQVIDGKRGDRYFEARMLSRAEERR